MKKIVLISLTLLAGFLNSAFGQNNVYLKINHQLGADPFAFNFDTKSSDGEEVKFSRLEYYIGQIVLVHDGGKLTKVEDTWILVDANSSTLVNLGKYAVNNLEEVRFGIGVEPEVNHGDPSTFAPNHPLAPKAPSMHWGWAAGYRYVALEGLVGPNRDQDLQIHALGDDNYKQIKIATKGSLVANDLTIELVADYQKSLSGIVTKSGLLIHANNKEAAVLMSNFHTKVFKSVEGNSSMLSVHKGNTLAARLFPNPSKETSTLLLEEVDQIQSIVVFNQQGQEVCRINNPESLVHLTAPSAGLYFIQAISNSQTFTALKWVVSK